MPLAISLGLDLMIFGHTHSSAVSGAFSRYEPNLRTGRMIRREGKVIVGRSWPITAATAQKNYSPVSLAHTYAQLSDESYRITTYQE